MRSSSPGRCRARAAVARLNSFASAAAAQAGAGGPYLQVLAAQQRPQCSMHLEVADCMGQHTRSDGTAGGRVHKAGQVHGIGWASTHTGNHACPPSACIRYSGACTE